MASKKKQQLKSTSIASEAKASLQSESMNSQKRNLIICLLLGVFAFLLFANTINHEFMIDDSSAITYNRFVKNGFHDIGKILTTEYRAGFWNNNGNLYRPLPLVVFATVWNFFPDKPAVFHLINCLAFAATAMLMFMLLMKLLKPKSYLLPLLITLLFIVHPIHTEVVANIKSLDELLSLFFTLFSCFALLIYYETQDKKHFLGFSVSFFLALCSKEGAITFLVVVPLVLYFFTDAKKKDYLLTTGVALLPILAFLALRTYALSTQKGTPYTLDIIGNSLVGAHNFAERTASCFYQLGKYLFMSFYPHPLSVDYTFNQIPLVQWSDIYALLSLLVYAGLLVLVLLRFKKKEAWIFGILFYLITISLYSNLIYLIGTNFAERLLYTPSLGICMALLLFLDKVLPNQSSGAPWMQKKILVAITTLLLVAGSIRTYSRNEDWKDQLTICKADIKATPQSAKLNYWTGQEILNDLVKRKVPETDRHEGYTQCHFYLSRAIAIYPNYADAYATRGRVNLSLNQPDSAIYDFKMAADNGVSDWNINNNLAALLGQRGQYETAIEYLKKALLIDDQKAVIYKNLGSCYQMLGNKTEAINYYKQALQHASPSEEALVKEVRANLSNLSVRE